MKKRHSDLNFFQHEETACTRCYYPTWPQEAVASCIHQCQLMADTHNYSMSIDGGFMWFRRNTQEDELICPSRGIKFHVSLSHDISHYCQGMNVVMEVLFELGITPFKIVHPSFLSTPEYAEAGREITIYTIMYRDTPIVNGQFNARLSQLIKTINDRLALTPILPYQNEKQERTIPVKDSEIPECLFISWRDDRTFYGCDVPKMHGISLYQSHAVSTEEELHPQHNNRGPV